MHFETWLHNHPYIGSIMHSHLRDHIVFSLSLLPPAQKLKLYSLSTSYFLMQNNGIVAPGTHYTFMIVVGPVTQYTFMIVVGPVTQYTFMIVVSMFYTL
jgi:hypothetical protein